MTMIKQLFEWC